MKKRKQRVCENILPIKTQSSLTIEEKLSGLGEVSESHILGIS
jgi:hypothetical protein